MNIPDKAEQPDTDTLNDQEELALFLTVVYGAFEKSGQEPIEIPLAAFQPLSFKQISDYISRFSGEKTFTVRGRPQSPSDTAPYRFEASESQKATHASAKKELEHLRDLQMLAIYWGKICEIYDAITGGNVGFEDGLINRNYVLLTIRLDKLLAKDEFVGLREERPFIYDSFMGNIEDLDMAYEFMRPELWGFYGKLERMWIEEADGVGTFKLEDDEQRLLDGADESIKKHKQRKAKLNTNFEKHLDTISAKAEAEKPTNPSDNEGSPIGYDSEHGTVTYKQKAVSIFSPATLEGFLMYRTHHADGDRLEYTGIAIDYESKHPELDKDITLKALTNSKDRINEKLQKAFGIGLAILYDHGEFWLNHKYCSGTSPYRTPSSDN